MKRQQKNVGLFLHNSLHANACHASSQLTDRWAGQQTREYIDWLRPRSCVRSVIMVFLAQVGWAWWVYALPPFTPSTPRIVLHRPLLLGPSPAKLAREYYLYGPKWPISLFSQSRTFCFLQQKNHGSISCSENDTGLVINGTGERKKWKTNKWIRKKKIIRIWRWKKRRRRGEGAVGIRVNGWKVH
jgi:hypothetical protein